MNKDIKGQSLAIFLLIGIFAICAFTYVNPLQKTFASGITIYSPYWVNYEKNLRSPYFESCGIFDSCLSNDNRIFQFLPLITHAEKNDNTYFSPKTTISPPHAEKDDNTYFSPKTTISPPHAEKDDNTYFSPKTTISHPSIPFELPFP